MSNVSFSHPEFTILDHMTMERITQADPPQAVKPSHPAPEEKKSFPDSERQAQYWEEYRLQQARRACPGCGDDGVLY
jgi:hypothetical protein